MRKLLSVCIPTYNRCDMLLELIEPIVLLGCEKINIVITDNCSTDGTPERVLEKMYKDVHVIVNERPIGAVRNMSEAMFNGDGYFCMYCNDRDIIIPEKLVSIVDLLESNLDASYVYSTASGNNTNNLCWFNNAFDSLCNQQCKEHPTGIIINRDMLNAGHSKQFFYDKAFYGYPLAYMMRDVVQYGKSAIYDIGAWRQIGIEFKVKNRSGATSSVQKLYFYPPYIEQLAEDTLFNIFEEHEYGFTKEQNERILDYVTNFFFNELIWYKQCMEDVAETSHYGLVRRRIGWLEMYKMYKDYFFKIRTFIETKNYSERTKCEWKRQWDVWLRHLFGQYLALEKAKGWDRFCMTYQYFKRKLQLGGKNNNE